MQCNLPLLLHLVRWSHLIKFLDVILGSLIAAPTKLLPVMKIPLHERVAFIKPPMYMCCRGVHVHHKPKTTPTPKPKTYPKTYHAAPIIDSATHVAMPKLLQKYGDILLNKNKSHETSINQIFIVEKFFLCFTPGDNENPCSLRQQLKNLMLEQR